MTATPDTPSNTAPPAQAVDRAAVLAVLAEMNTAARLWRLEAALHTDPGGTVPVNLRAALAATRAENAAEVLDALPDWIAALTAAVGNRTWTIVYRHPGADRSSIDAVVGPDLHHALLARALARHPDWAAEPDEKAVERLLAEDWPGAVAIDGEHTVFIFGGAA